MSAETLRRAAAWMRERAEGATPGPWASDAAGEQWRTWDGHVETRHPDFEDVDNTVAKTLSNDDSQHIASWHPDVALAVADWLETEATLLDNRLTEPTHAALTVARACLGEQS